eukprot:7749885-Pyramimonas_sp.AAC.1
MRAAATGTLRPAPARARARAFLMNVRSRSSAGSLLPGCGYLPPLEDSHSRRCWRVWSQASTFVFHVQPGIASTTAAWSFVREERR